MPSDSLIKRADLVLGDLESNGGLLQPEQANRFIDFIQEQPTIVAQSRLIRMNSPQRLIDRMGFDRRILQAANNSGSDPAAEGLQDDSTNDRFLARELRSKVTTTQIKLETSELIGEVRIPYEVLEDNLERGGLEAHIMRQMAERFAIDLEEFALLADTDYTGDPEDEAYFGLQDGWLKRMNVNLVNHNSIIAPEMFVNGMLAMPQKYLRDLGRLKHFVTIQDAIRYRNVVSQRATGYGDAMLTTSAPIYAAGVQVETAPLMPQTLGFFTFPSNLLFGIQRQISVETDKDIRSREIIIVVTCRVALQIDDVDATVKYTNILPS